MSGQKNIESKDAGKKSNYQISHEGSGESERSDLLPLRKESVPADAIITALSVHIFFGGRNNSQSSSSAISLSLLRRPEFAATPPESVSLFTPVMSAASFILHVRDPITAFWKDAQISSFFKEVPVFSEFLIILAAAVFNPLKLNSTLPDEESGIGSA